ncbi:MULTISPECIES: D-alanyl-lipoteichoic acid biosynthesis protein DltD [unclassified Clostridium]|uniref:D-alanyl-lipoteichoic acid biosynthesis protein DltD n=1 Tax=unclassified Clostridium TaxID=2614128 RepID=UPI00029851C6|nr:MULTISPECIES: D-alanyl-lipoteichoic acid biosynthesis protein DltD [unclassified Clostridium]EKQ50433.1 MAG: D-alanyl-lipoteichoic acid biosynthesis protein DltD [Clostridium sp. Maddingley MBC34-26]
MKKIISILTPVIITVFVIVVLNSLLDSKIQQLTNEKDISMMGKLPFDTVKDKSSLAKKMLSDKGDMFLLGSSEIGISVPQNPLGFFPFKGGEYNFSCFGRPFTQDLQQAAYLGGGNVKDNQKVVYILSIQWFEDANGLEPDQYAANFSEVQFYNFFKNPKISEENKRYYAERVYDFLTKAKKNQPEAYYAKLYLDSSAFSNAQKIVLKPYYEIKQYLLSIQDKALIYEKLKGLPNKSSGQSLSVINWNDEYAKVEKDNEAIVSTNQFNLDDKKYNLSLKNELNKHEGESKNENLIESKEMGDYKFFLSVCKDIGIKPYIVIPPVNGWYYDFAGLAKNQRDEWNEQVKKIAEDNGLEFLDLHDYDYKKYFLIDTKHLGEEGWLKVDEGIYTHFNK